MVVEVPKAFVKVAVCNVALVRVLVLLGIGSFGGMSVCGAVGLR